MKLVVVSHSCVIAQNQRVFAELAASDELELELILPSRWVSEYTRTFLYPSYLPNAPFRAHPLPVSMKGSVSLHFFRRGLAKKIRDLSPDLVFLDEEPWSLAAAQVSRICRKLDIPLVCYTKQNVVRRYPPPFRWIEQCTYRHATAMVALTNESRDVLRSKGYRGDCNVIPHGCDLEQFFPGKEETLRKKLNLRGLVIGYMGRYIPVKGLHLLVEAIALLCRSPYLDFKVLMIGAGPLENELRDLVGSHVLAQHFVFAGPIDHGEAGQYLRCMDLLVLPSITMARRKEQFGRVLIEAMACGVPVVGSSSGGIPLLIDDTGGGQVFEEGNSADLARVLARLVASPEYRQALAQAGRASVTTRYTHRVIAAKLHDVLLKVAKVARSGQHLAKSGSGSGAESEGDESARAEMREKLDSSAYADDRSLASHER